jgi:hypothetical protein
MWYWHTCVCATRYTCEHAHIRTQISIFACSFGSIYVCILMRMNTETCVCVGECITCVCVGECILKLRKNNNKYVCIRMRMHTSTCVSIWDNAYLNSICVNMFLILKLNLNRTSDMCKYGRMHTLTQYV